MASILDTLKAKGMTEEQIMKILGEIQKMPKLQVEAIPEKEEEVQEFELPPGLEVAPIKPGEYDGNDSLKVEPISEEEQKLEALRKIRNGRV